MTGRARDAGPADAEAIAAIYDHYVEKSVATFETEPLSATEMAARIAESHGADYPWLVWEEDDRVLGFAYARPFRDRAAYRHTAETTIYLDSGATGRGAGRTLYAALLERLRGRGTRALVALIATPNDASIGLHEALGFQRVGLLREVGRKQGRWVDVELWESTLGGPTDPDS